MSPPPFASRVSVCPSSSPDDCSESAFSSFSKSSMAKGAWSTMVLKMLLQMAANRVRLERRRAPKRQHRRHVGPVKPKAETHSLVLAAVLQKGWMKTRFCSAVSWKDKNITITIILEQRQPWQQRPRSRTNAPRLQPLSPARSCRRPGCGTAARRAPRRRSAGPEWRAAPGTWRQH